MLPLTVMAEENRPRPSNNSMKQRIHHRMKQADAHVLEEIRGEIEALPSGAKIDLETSASIARYLEDPTDHGLAALMELAPLLAEKQLYSPAVLMSEDPTSYSPAGRNRHLFLLHWPRDSAFSQEIDSYLVSSMRPFVEEAARRGYPMRATPVNEAYVRLLVPRLVEVDSSEADEAILMFLFCPLWNDSFPGHEDGEMARWIVSQLKPMPKDRRCSLLQKFVARFPSQLMAEGARQNSVARWGDLRPNLKAVLSASRDCAGVEAEVPEFLQRAVTQVSELPTGDRIVVMDTAKGLHTASGAEELKLQKALYEEARMLWCREQLEAAAEIVKQWLNESPH